jgi:hypothetical protein
MTVETMERPAAPDHKASNFVARLLALGDSEAVAAGQSRASIYEKRLTETPPRAKFDQIPWSVYFYYVRLDTDGRLRVKHYFYDKGAPIPHDTLATVVQGLVDRIRAGDPTLPITGRNFQNLEWKRKSYIAFFVDEENWTLHKNGNPLDGIRFDNSPTPNHSFFDAVDLKVTVTNARSGAVTQRSAIVFINHMKRNAAGDDLQNTDAQAYKFDMIFDVKFSDDTTAPMVVIFDPDGTNIGGPIPPP